MRYLFFIALIWIFCGCGHATTHNDISKALDTLAQQVDTLAVLRHRDDSLTAVQQRHLLAFSAAYVRLRDLKDSADNIYIQVCQGTKTYREYVRAMDVLRLYMRTDYKKAKDSL